MALTTFADKGGQQVTAQALDSNFATLQNEVNAATQAAQAAASGQNWKSDVVAASTANINIASALINGSVVDGVTLATGNRVLLIAQTDATQNGIYVVVASGAASRSTDANTSALITGTLVFVAGGTVNGNKQFALTTPAPIALGTSALTFTAVIDQGAVNASAVQPLVNQAQSYANSAQQSLASISQITSPHEVFYFLPGDALPGLATVIVNQSGYVVTPVYQGVRGPSVNDLYSDGVVYFLTGDGLPGALCAVNESGYVCASVSKPTGITPSNLDDLNMFAVYDPDYASIIASDAKGHVAAGIRYSGLLDANYSAPKVLPYISGTSPNRVLRAKAKNLSGTIADIQLSQPGHDISDTAPPPQATGNTVAFFDATDSVLDAELAVPPQLPAGVTTLYLVLGYGQSNSSYFDGAPVQTIVPDHARSLMPVGGQIMGDPYSSVVVPLEHMATLTGAWAKQPYGIATQWGESILPGAGYALATRLPSTAAVVTASFGIGGAPISTLGTTSRPYKNMIRYVQRLQVMCALAGVTLIVPGIIWVQGEADVTGNAATWTTALQAIQTTADSQIRAITGQTQTVAFFCNPICSWTQAGVATSAIELAAGVLAVADAGAAGAVKFQSCAPMYTGHFAVSLHDDGPSRRLRGEITGHAIADYWLGAVLKPFCFVSGWSRSGAVVTLQFPRAVTFDTSIVSDPGNAGIRFFQTGGNSVTVSSVAIGADPTKIDVTLSSVPTGTAMTVGIADAGTSGAAAGNQTGPRSTIREATSFANSKAGAPLYRYAIPQQVAIS
jgi:hypothetical protein